MCDVIVTLSLSNWAVADYSKSNGTVHGIYNGKDKVFSSTLFSSTELLVRL